MSDGPDLVGLILVSLIGGIIGFAAAIFPLGIVGALLVTPFAASLTLGMVAGFCSIRSLGSAVTA